MRAYRSARPARTCDLLISSQRTILITSVPLMLSPSLLASLLPLLAPLPRLCLHMQAAASASLLLLAACAIILVGNREEDAVSLSQRSTRGLVQRLLSLSTGGEFQVDGYSHRQLGRQVDKLQVRMGKIQTAIDGWAPKNAALKTGIQSIWGGRNDAHSLTEYADDHLRDVSNRVDGHVKEIMDGSNGRWLKSASYRIRMGAHALMMQQHKRDAAQDSRLDALEQVETPLCEAYMCINEAYTGIYEGVLGCFSPTFRSILHIFITINPELVIPSTGKTQLSNPLPIPQRCTHSTRKDAASSAA